MKDRYILKCIIKDCVMPEGLYELKDTKSDFYAMIEGKRDAKKIANLLNSKEQTIREMEKDSNETIIAGLKVIEDACLLRDKYFDLMIDNVVFRTALKMACTYFLYPNTEDNKILSKRLSIHNEHPPIKVNEAFKYFENKARNKGMVGGKYYGKKENR